MTIGKRVSCVWLIEFLFFESLIHIFIPLRAVYVGYINEEVRTMPEADVFDSRLEFLWSDGGFVGL